jgi:hypothetical protein
MAIPGRTVWGFAMLSAILLMLRVGPFQTDSVALSGGACVRLALAWGVTFLAVSLSEELAFRGYWLFSTARRLRFWPAALFLSAVFGVAHLGNKGENVLGIVQVVATGLLFCLMIRRTGNLWFAIGFQAAWDWAETFLWRQRLLGAGRFLNSSVRGPKHRRSAEPEGSVSRFHSSPLCAADSSAVPESDVSRSSDLSTGLKPVSSCGRLNAALGNGNVDQG